MTKNQFFKLLREKLDILEDNEIEDIITEYESHIEEKIKAGKTQKEAIADFGDIDELINDILSAYKVKSKNKPNESKAESIINTIVEEMVDFFKKLTDIINNKTGEDIIRIVCQIILIMILIWVLRLPFYILEVIGNQTLNFLPHYIEGILTVIWSLIVNIAYILVGIMLFYNLVRKIIFTKDNTSDSKTVKPEPVKTEPVTKPKASVKNNDQIIYKEDIPKNNSVKYREDNYDRPTSILLTLITTMAKIFMVIISTPIIFGLIALMVVFGMMISALFSGVYIVSLFLIIGGLILIGLSVLGIIYRIVFGNGGKK